MLSTATEKVLEKKKKKNMSSSTNVDVVAREVHNTLVQHGFAYAGDNFEHDWKESQGFFSGYYARGEFDGGVYVSLVCRRNRFRVHAMYDRRVIRLEALANKVVQDPATFRDRLERHIVRPLSFHERPESPWPNNLVPPSFPEAKASLAGIASAFEPGFCPERNRSSEPNAQEDTDPLSSWDVHANRGRRVGEPRRNPWGPSGPGGQGMLVGPRNPLFSGPGAMSRPRGVGEPRISPWAPWPRGGNNTGAPDSDHLPVPRPPATSRKPE